MSEIISLTEIIESKVVKEKELEYYYDQLKDIQRKIGMLEFDLKLTKKIISMIENEKVVSIEKKLHLIGKENDKANV